MAAHGLDALRDVVSGTVAGTCGIAVGHPLDCIKVRLQVASSGVGAGGILNAARAIVAESGVRGFFRGLSSPIVANAPINAVVFAVEAAATRLLARERPSWSTPFAHAVAGSAAGLSQVLIACPFELVKLQMQTGTQFASSAACARHIVHAHGAHALYRGFALTLLRDTVSWGIYFGVYDLCKERMLARLVAEGSRGADGGDEPMAAVTLPISTLMLCGGTAGVASWLLLHPVDVLKSIQQGLPLDTPLRERSVVALWRAQMAAHGPAFMLRGLGTTCVRAFPTSAVTFPIFEMCVKAFDGAYGQDGEEVGGAHR